MIGIIGAMDVEVENLKAQIENKKIETVSGVEFVSGRIFDKDVVVAKCGIGKVFASICAEAMILKYAPDVIINTGVAGTLTEELSIGDVAISQSVCQHDMDTSPIGDPKGLLSGINIINIPADEILTEIAQNVIKAHNINCKKGVIASGDQFIASKEQKDFIVSEFSAIACEMEGASIGHVCFVNNVKFLVLRAISDSADNSSHMDYPTFLKMASENSTKVTLEIIRRI